MKRITFSQDSRTFLPSLCFTFYPLFRLKWTCYHSPQGGLVYTMGLVLSEKSRRFSHLFIIYGSRRRLPFSRSQWQSADTGDQKLHSGSPSSRWTQQLPLLSFWDAFCSECCFLVPQLFLFVAISTLLLLASVEVASWQLLRYVSNEIFWGPINSQPLQLASEDQETNELGERPRLSNLAAVPQRGPTFRTLMGFYSAAGFCILSSWTALGSWGLLLDSLKQELRRWVVCEREAALGVSVEGSECKLLARCFYPWLSRFAFQSC